jgi:hypothetical protein
MNYQQQRDATKQPARFPLWAASCHITLGNAARLIEEIANTKTTTAVERPPV